MVLPVMCREGTWVGEGGEGGGWQLWHCEPLCNAEQQLRCHSIFSPGLPRFASKNADVSCMRIRERILYRAAAASGPTFISLAAVMLTPTTASVKKYIGNWVRSGADLAARAARLGPCHRPEWSRTLRMEQRTHRATFIKLLCHCYHFVPFVNKL